MNSLIQRMQETGQNLIVDSGILGIVPFLGGMRGADWLLRDDLPHLARIGAKIAAGYLVHRETHRFFQTELYLGKISTGGLIGFRPVEAGSTPSPVSTHEKVS